MTKFTGPSVFERLTSECLDSAFRVNHVHYQPDEYGEDSDLLGYEDGDYDQNYHRDNR